MGWDAYATKDGVDIGPVEEFKNAEKKVHELADGADADLRDGGLNTSACAHEIEKALGAFVWDEEDWSPEKVKMLQSTAKWEEPMNKDNLWAYYSAKVFIETCVENGFGIRFSF